MHWPYVLFLVPSTQERAAAKSGEPRFWYGFQASHRYCLLAGNAPAETTLDNLVIGCKWPPFEVSYYRNGKLIPSEANHRPYNSVTFPPFNHATG